MFLKKKEFTYDGETVVLYELSALQRIDYLAFLAEKTPDFDNLPEDSSPQMRAQAFMQLNVDINIWLVSRSLAHGNKAPHEEATYQEVLNTWSYDALSAGAEMVLDLSGMNMSVERKDAEEPRSAEKS
ncbi:TPA: phage minor tail protein G [Yersinia enterocolitica]|nr:phage minor tail protein G [Yersinia enterocolitica]